MSQQVAVSDARTDVQNKNELREYLQEYHWVTKFALHNTGGYLYLDGRPVGLRDVAVDKINECDYEIENISFVDGDVRVSLTR